jgi:uncharacterized membrane protein
MQGIKRKVVYVYLYEAIAIALTSTVLALLGNSAVDAGIAAVGASAIAVMWNLAWNSLFEWWESRQKVRGRSVKRRVAHAIGFEGGLVVFLVPFFAWLLQISWWEALVLDAGFILFFLVYSFVFNWVFDIVFGLPRSALGPSTLS